MASESMCCSLYLIEQYLALTFIITVAICEFLYVHRLQQVFTSMCAYNPTRRVLQKPLFS